MTLAHSQKKYNYKPNYCKQTKRNSFELAGSHRLFTVVNDEKRESRETGETGEKGEPVSTNQTQIILSKRNITSYIVHSRTFPLDTVVKPRTTPSNTVKPRTTP